MNSTNIRFDIYFTLFLCMSKQLKAKDYESEREARRMNLATEWLDMRNYARCEWKCFYTHINALQRTAGRQLDQR